MTEHSFPVPLRKNAFPVFYQCIAGLLPENSAKIMIENAGKRAIIEDILIAPAEEREG